jgi:hypothetical protein
MGDIFARHFHVLSPSGIVPYFGCHFLTPKMGFFRVNLSKHLWFVGNFADMEDHSRPARLIDVNLGTMADKI